ncbi:MAG: OmpA family protein [Pseudomonadota bacterium]|nr:OmpA family protein [Pseudomonadota bacterium]
MMMYLNQSHRSCWLPRPTVSRDYRVVAGVLLGVLLSFFPAWASPTATPAPRIDPRTAPVVVSGTVPDAQTKQAILARVSELYGDRVVDQIQVAAVRTPPLWTETVLSSIRPELQTITQGRLAIHGPLIQLYGNVTSEQGRKALDQQLSKGLPSAYRASNLLEVVAPEQAIVDKALANRIVEFESGSTTLTPIGLGILDEVANALKQVGQHPVKIIGHTDSQGDATANLKLSKNRAEAVKQYLIGRGIKATLMSTEGQGANQPIASNDTDEGRKRNRRIAFQLVKS